MSIFKEETESKRVIFNIRLDLAERLEAAKEGAKNIGRKLDVDTSVNEALEKYLKKAEKRIVDMLDKQEELRSVRITSEEPEPAGTDPEPATEQAAKPAAKQAPDASAAKARPKTATKSAK